MTFTKEPTIQWFRNTQHWLIWQLGKSTKYGGIYDPMPGEIFTTQTSAGKRKKELIEDYKDNNKKYMNSTFIITKLYVYCPECKLLVPDGMIDKIYDICRDCTANMKGVVLNASISG